MEEVTRAHSFFLIILLALYLAMPTMAVEQYETKMDVGLPSTTSKPQSTTQASLNEIDPRSLVDPSSICPNASFIHPSFLNVSKYFINCGSSLAINWEVDFKPKLMINYSIPYTVTSHRLPCPSVCIKTNRKCLRKGYFESSLQFNESFVYNFTRNLQITCRNFKGNRTKSQTWTVTFNSTLNLLKGDYLKTNSINSTNATTPTVKILNTSSESIGMRPCSRAVLQWDSVESNYDCTISGGGKGVINSSISYLPCSDWTNCQQLAGQKFNMPCPGALNNLTNRNFSVDLNEGLIYCKADEEYFQWSFFKGITGNEKDSGLNIMVDVGRDEAKKFVRIHSTFETNKSELEFSVILTCSSPKYISIQGFEWKAMYEDHTKESKHKLGGCSHEVHRYDTEDTYVEVRKCKHPSSYGVSQVNFSCIVHLQSGEQFSINITVQKDLEKSEKGFPLPQSILYAGGGMVACFLILCPILCVTYICCYQKNRILAKAVRDLTDKEEEEFLYGKENPDGNDYHYIIFSRAFDKKYELFADELKIGIGDTVLGSGQYGVVKQGQLRRRNSPINDTLHVAIKTVKEQVETQYFLALLSEVKIMAYLEEHENIVKFIGAWIESIKTRQMFVVVEFCSKGDLLGVLKKMKLNCSNKDDLGSDGKLMLYKWARDIASGLAYISYKNVIHGDLAARNILISAADVAKISDYGLSRIVQENSSVYSKKTRTPLPWKWMAPESLESLSFTLKSDVWSFGVTLWEIFSLGNHPYPGTECNHEFIQKLINGYKLPQPTFADQRGYELMKNCWEILPQQRPDIQVIKEKIVEIINQMTSHLYHNTLESSDPRNCFKNQ